MSINKVFTMEFYDGLKKTNLFNDFKELTNLFFDSSFVHILGGILSQEPDGNCNVRSKLSNYSSFGNALNRDPSSNITVMNFFSLFIDIRFSRFIHVINNLPDKMISYKVYRAIMSRQDLKNMYISNTCTSDDPYHLSVINPTFRLLMNDDILMAGERFKSYVGISVFYDTIDWIIKKSINHISHVLKLDYHQLINPIIFDNFKNYTKNYTKAPSKDHSPFTAFVNVFCDSDTVLLASIIDKIDDMDVRDTIIRCFTDNPSFTHSCWKNLFQSIRLQRNKQQKQNNIQSNDTIATMNLDYLQTQQNQQTQLIQNSEITIIKTKFTRWFESTTTEQKYGPGIRSIYDDVVKNKILLTPSSKYDILSAFVPNGERVEMYFGNDFALQLLININLDKIEELLQDLVKIIV